ncbi:murein DD-endopeptidase MepM/ murein hydrolase activator NlpD [Arthrobacter pigmenti]|uniref:Murein DD-endopeptidase MepM/ murein hydrolase activator NlpD n=1 Tax=Arthrobacter pigmenti TaxID=271432 RepID=A0A846RHZ7_9MICC|nr:murein DD-endopeptidase MepM/ murein hydrolase activator NlpD [Arthrobacter pigmenti]
MRRHSARSLTAGYVRPLGRPGVVKAITGLSLATVAALTLTLSGPVFADELDDRKNALEQEIAEVQQSIEYLDADITETIAQLKVYQGQLPGAQQALADAQGRVEAATAEVNALAQRVQLAEETKNKITEQLKQDEAEMAKTREVIGQIATQAYKSGGVPTSLSLMLGSDGGDSFASMELVDQALRSQNAALERLAQQNATNVNSQARLVAVEEEIRDLKAKADAALAAEQAARDEAAAEKAKVDKLVSDTSALSDKLQEQKPVIEAKLAQVEEAHQQVVDDIAERQRRLIEEARKREEARLKAEAEERARIENARRAAEAAEANRRAAEAAAAANRPAPAPVVPAPVAPVIEPPQTSSPSAFGLRAPVNGPITSGYGWRPTPLGTIDFNGTGGYTHTGIDYGVACGTPLYAPAAGEVWFADSNVLPGAGNRIVLNHGVIGGNALATNFYHLSSYLVAPGQNVSAGQLIGYTGTTGNSTGCHLHFETVLNGSLVDPMGVL